MTTSHFLPRDSSSSLPMICQICGDVARGFNFNVMTCTSCKTFFRRYAYRRQYIKCQFSNNCSITKLTRSYCSYCRLEKCFQLGMDALLIRSIPKYPREDRKQREQKKTNHEEKSLQLPQPRTLDLLQNDRSTLTTDQWNLISNIIHVYDQVLPIEQIRRSFNQILFLPPKFRSKPGTLLTIIGEFHTCVQSLIGRSSHFQSLSRDEYRILFKRNIYMAGGLNSLFIYRELDLHSNPFIMNITTSIYGNEIVQRTRRNCLQCDPNGNLIKIFIFILFFSTNTSIVSSPSEEDFQTMLNSINCLEIQNFYVTTLWKYLLYLYGFEQAVLRFSSLVKCALHLLVSGEIKPGHKIHFEMVDRIASLVEKPLIIKD